MKQYFKNKFFYIMIVLALLFTIVPTVLYNMGASFPVRNIINTMLTPVQKLFNYTADAIDGYVSYIYKFDEIVEENKQLRERVNTLESQIYDTREMEESYLWLSEFLDLKMQHTDYEMMDATVTGRESGNYSSVLTLDKGSGAGVEVNMPVITSEGIVGRVTDVGYNWCTVTTITESQSSVGAYVERTDETGIVNGNFSTASEGLCDMLYLSADCEAQVGDRVLSSGYGSVYPRGLVIGYIESMEPDSVSRSMAVKVKCASDFSEVSKVMIIMQYTIYQEN